MYMMSIREVFSFPPSVDNHTTRTVAGRVVIWSIVTIVLGVGWMVPLLAAGYAARVFTGATLCLSSHLSRRVIIPLLKLPEEHVNGPPQRFAQIIGLVVGVLAVFPSRLCFALFYSCRGRA